MKMRAVRAVVVMAVSMFAFCGAAIAQDWSNYAGNAQHTAVSAYTAQALQELKWSTPVDLNPQYAGGGVLLAHYGSPLITAANTVIVPVKTGATSGFKLEGRSGVDGSLLWTQATSYVRAPIGGWFPPFSPAITGTGRVYLPDIGGTITYRDNIDSAVGATGQIHLFADYGSNTSFYNNNIYIDTPITTDAAGNLYFGYYSTTGTIDSGIARVDTLGNVTRQSVPGLSSGMGRVLQNAAPALSNDGSTLYIAVKSAASSTGRLLALDSTNLTLESSVDLLDHKTGNPAQLNESGTASPMIGPDGDVYMGVLDNTSRGWMLHFSGDLATQKPTGGFGWDDTASVVPASMVEAYTGTSDYLIMTKYNNYYQTGGQGQNMIALLDPNDTQLDPRLNSTGTMIMKEVMTILGPTPDDASVLINFPDAVREWCINTAVVDPSTCSVLVNNEDGKLYRWFLDDNTLSEVFTLGDGLGQAYTPTLIGPDGTVYAISNATLFAIGAATIPEPSTLMLLAAGSAFLWRRRPR